MNESPTGEPVGQDYISVIAMAPGGGGAGCYDVTPNNHIAGSRVSIAGSANVFVGQSAQGFANAPRSGGQGGSFSGQAGVLSEQLPETAENNFGNS